MAISANEQDKLTNALWLITKTNPFNIFDTPGDFRPLLSFISDSQSRVQFNLETHLLYNRVELCGYTDIVIEATLMNLKSPPPYLLWPSQLSLGASFQRRKVISWLKACVCLAYSSVSSGAGRGGSIGKKLKGTMARILSCQK